MTATRQPALPYGAEYPGRPPFFAHKFTRLLSKVCAAHEVGPEGCWLLTSIAHTEDSVRYARAPTFFTEHLVNLLGMSGSTFKRVREKCVALGWLHYEPGARGKPGRYWVTLPDHASGVEDWPVEEGAEPALDASRPEHVGSRETAPGPAAATASIPDPGRDRPDPGRAGADPARATTAPETHPHTPILGQICTSVEPESGPNLNQYPDGIRSQSDPPSYLIQSPNPPPPPPRGEPAPARWKAAAAEMIALGVESSPWSAISAAQALGASPQEVLAGIAHYRQVGAANGWGPAALYRWVSACGPGTPPEVGWPQVDRRVQQRRETAERAELDRETQRQEELRRRSAQEQAEAREERWGPVLDALPREQVEDLLRGNPFVLRRWRSDPASRSVRGVLLATLEQCGGVVPVAAGKPPTLTLATVQTAHGRRPTTLE